MVSCQGRGFLFVVGNQGAADRFASLEIPCSKSILDLNFSGINYII